MSKFQFLIPSKSADNVEVYIDALNKALKNHDVKNIAISGSYGAGKSSFIKTFEDSHKTNNYKFLDISLATFPKDGKETPDISIVEKVYCNKYFTK